MAAYFIGVDVGTSSVRAALVSETGEVVKTSVESVRIWNPSTEIYEQSANDIWRACCKTVKEVAGDLGKSVQGIGFDATCSLVVLDKDMQPLSVSQSGETERNIIMWLDHRAEEQAERINKTGQEAAAGNTWQEISLEMEPPKLLWLKEHLKEECWKQAGAFFDLADFMTWRATGSQTRSQCTVVCKWQYRANHQGLTEWDEAFYARIGLEDLVQDGCAKIGTDVQLPGEPCGSGLSPEAARELGLRPGLPVGTGIIDAYAGGIGMLGGSVEGHSLPCENQPLTSRLALICGTSTCLISLSRDACHVGGVWGPYYSSMVGGMWCNEGGESCTGKLIDHIIHTHHAYAQLQEQCHKSGCSLYSWLDDHLMTMARDRGWSSVAKLTRDLHVCPYFYGNRSPFEDPTLRGMICGLTISSSLEDLALLYLATLQALAHGTRLIIAQMVSCGYDISTLFACGGLCKSELFLQTHADITGLPIVLPKEPESVLVGAAILGACASGKYSLQDAMKNMCGVRRVVLPDEQQARYYERKHKVFTKMVKDQREYRSLMEDPV